MATVVLAGALDTKSADYAFVRDQLLARSADVLLVDFGVMGDPALQPDISASDIATAGGIPLSELRAAGDKALAMRTMQQGLVETIKRLHGDGRLDGIMALGGGGGTAIATTAMQALPLGIPKLIVSTVAAGDVAPYVGTRDILMLHSVVDVAGVNRISRQIYTNAAAAMAGMLSGRQYISASEEDKQETKHATDVLTHQPADTLVTGSPFTDSPTNKPLITASMFGNTTPCITHAQALLEQAGYEVVVFHATGTGGRTMEGILADGFAAGNLDLTTTELADDLCGGVLGAGPDRLLAAARRGVPTVLAPGCVDMANFWARATVPARYRDRLLYEWNSNITLMRTNLEENRAIGERIAAAANASTGPVAVLIPLGGVSQLDSPGGAFWDPAADAACFNAIRANLRADIPLLEMECNINDPAFAERAVALLRGMIE